MGKKTIALAASANQGTSPVGLARGAVMPCLLFLEPGFSFCGDALQNVQSVSYTCRVKCGSLQRFFGFALLEVIGV